MHQDNKIYSVMYSSNNCVGLLVYVKVLKGFRMCISVHRLIGLRDVEFCR